VQATPSGIGTNLKVGHTSGAKCRRFFSVVPLHLLGYTKTIK